MPNSRTWTPKPDDYTRIFDEQNPWHVSGNVPHALSRQVERPLATHLWKSLRNSKLRRFQLVLGPRRVGKTTSLYQTINKLLASGIPRHKIWWLRLDHPLLMRVSLDNLAHLAIKIGKGTPEEPIYLFLDELVYALDWDLWLKTFYDDHWPVLLAGSSSSTAVLKDRRVESGVGRWEEQYLAPYLFKEFLELVNHAVRVPTGATLADTIHACIDERLDVSKLANLRRIFLLTGGFPELLLTVKDNIDDEASILLQSQRTLRNDAVERAVYKDIPQAFGVDNPMILERMLYTLAGQCTGVLSPNSICREMDGLSQPTFDRYLSYLQQAFLVFTLLNYSGNEKSKQKRGRKLYFVDGAIRNAALQRGLSPLGDTIEMGMLFENLVAGHLHALSQQTQIRIYHWRHKNNEIDLIYDHPDHPVAFEISSSASHSRSGINRFMEQFPRFRGHCYIVAPNIAVRLPKDSSDGIGSIPLDLLLLAISAQAEQELEETFNTTHETP